VRELLCESGHDPLKDINWAPKQAFRQIEWADSGAIHVETDQFRAPTNEIATELLPEVTKFAASRAQKEPDVLKTKELVNRGGLEPPTRCHRTKC